jgi:hypothetical protein
VGLRLRRAVLVWNDDPLLVRTHLCLRRDALDVVTASSEQRGRDASHESKLHAR